jgi:hypothetical protein
MLRTLTPIAIALSLLGTAAQPIQAAEWSLQGYWGGSGDGPGQLRDPRALAVGPNEHVYVADYGHGRIQQFDAEGNFIRSWGALGEDADFGYLKSIEVGPQGDVYVLDGNHIHRFAGDGTYVGRTAANEDVRGYDLAIAADGTLYTAGSDRLFVHDENLARIARIDGVTGCSFDSYSGIAVAGQLIHLIDAYCQSIDVYTPSGERVAAWQLSNLPSAFSMAASSDRFFLTSPTQREIRILMSGGIDSGESIAMPEIEGTVPIPTAVTVHGDLVYVLAGDYVLKFAPTTAVENGSWSQAKVRYR